MNKKKTILISTGVLGVLSVGALSLIGNYFYNLALNPKISKDSIFRTIKNDVDNNTSEKPVNWILDESNYSNIYIEAYDKLKLHGYKILNKFQSAKWVITVHGYTGKGSDMANYAKNFYEKGFNLLIPDLRGHGKSEGTYIGMGWNDRLDILAWINTIIKDNPNAKIILHGISMGAATVTMTSGEKLPKNVKAIIADCGYTSVWNQFSHQLKALYSLPKFPIMNVSSIYSKYKAGYSLREASSIKQLSKCKTPILFIHGDKDDFVPYLMLDELYNATNCYKEKLTIEGAGHAMAAKVNPKLYWSSIENFINKYIS